MRAPGQSAHKQQLFERQFWDFVRPLTTQPGRKLVMSGSARQDKASDLGNRAQEDAEYEGFPDLQHDHKKKEGLVTTDLPLLAEQLDAEVYHLLFADGDGEAGMAWNRGSRTILGHGPVAHPWDDLKVSLLRFQIERLRQRYVDEDVTFHIYFFDDRLDILKAVSQRVKAADEAAGWSGLPQGVKLTCVHLDWFGMVYEGGTGLEIYDDDEGIPTPNPGILTPDKPTPKPVSVSTSFDSARALLNLFLPCFA